MMAPTRIRPTLLFEEVKRLDVLSAAWIHIRPRARSSNDPQTRQDLALIEGDTLGYLRRLQRELGSGTFRFAPQRAVLKKRPGKDPRGLVVAPLRNRIVQRAILDVCQNERPRIQRHLGALRDVLRTPTSVGGLPERGVVDALLLIRDATAAGATHFVRSDIKNFFVNVRRADVYAFLDTHVSDTRFLDLLKDGLQTELENAAETEVRAWWRLFPDDQKGVPQGSSLSALCANIALAQLDRELNGREVTTVRYLDDFLILAPSGAKAEKAWKNAQRILGNLGLEAHDPGGSSGKAGRGEIAAGFDFLSFHVNASGIAPSRSAKAEFLQDVTTCVNVAKRELLADLSDPRRAQGRFAQSLDLLDCKIRGWGDAFREADQRLTFAQLDRELDTLVQDYIRWFLSKVERRSPATQRRMWGIALLADTPPPKTGSRT